MKTVLGFSSSRLERIQVTKEPPLREGSSFRSSLHPPVLDSRVLVMSREKVMEARRGV